MYRMKFVLLLLLGASLFSTGLCWLLRGPNLNAFQRMAALHARQGRLIIQGQAASDAQQNLNLTLPQGNSLFQYGCQGDHDKCAHPLLCYETSLAKEVRQFDDIHDPLYVAIHEEGFPYLTAPDDADATHASASFRLRSSNFQTVRLAGQAIKVSHVSLYKSVENEEVQVSEAAEWSGGSDFEEWVPLPGGLSLPLANGWKSYGGIWGKPTVRVSNGICRIEGTAIIGDSSLPMTTLPAMCHPSKRHAFYVKLMSGMGTARVDVFQNGEVRLVDSGSIFGPVSLAGISFATVGLSHAIQLKDGYDEYNPDVFGISAYNISNGICHLEGLLRFDRSLPNAVGKLPEGCRPDQTLVFQTNVQITIQEDGMILHDESDPDVDTISLSGISFHTCTSWRCSEYGARFLRTITENGICRLYGRVQAPIKLPESCRPQKTLMFNINRDNTIVSIHKDGTVSFAAQSSNPISENDWETGISLCGIAFETTPENGAYNLSPGEYTIRVQGGDTGLSLRSLKITTGDSFFVKQYGLSTNGGSATDFCYSPLRTTIPPEDAIKLPGESQLDVWARFGLAESAYNTSTWNDTLGLLNGLETHSGNNCDEASRSAGDLSYTIEEQRNIAPSPWGWVMFAIGKASTYLLKGHTTGQSGLNLLNTVFAGMGLGGHFDIAKLTPADFAELLLSHIEKVSNCLEAKTQETIQSVLSGVVRKSDFKIMMSRLFTAVKGASTTHNTSLYEHCVYTGSSTSEEALEHLCNLDSNVDPFICLGPQGYYNNVIEVAYEGYIMVTTWLDTLAAMALESKNANSDNFAIYAQTYLQVMESGLLQFFATSWLHVLTQKVEASTACAPSLPWNNPAELERTILLKDTISVYTSLKEFSRQATDIAVDYYKFVYVNDETELHGGRINPQFDFHEDVAPSKDYTWFKQRYRTLEASVMKCCKDFKMFCTTNNLNDEDSCMVGDIDEPTAKVRGYADTCPQKDILQPFTPEMIFPFSYRVNQKSEDLPYCKNVHGNQRCPDKRKWPEWREGGPQDEYWDVENEENMEEIIRNDQTGSKFSPEPEKGRRILYANDTAWFMGAESQFSGSSQMTLEQKNVQSIYGFKNNRKYSTISREFYLGERVHPHFSTYFNRILVAPANAYLLSTAKVLVVSESQV